MLRCESLPRPAPRASRLDSASSASSSWVVIFTAAERAERVLSGWPMKALAEPKARARVTAENCMMFV